MSIESIAGLVIVVAGMVLILVFSLPFMNKKKTIFRPIPAFQYLRRGIGLAVEQGTRLHISLGKGDLLSSNNTSALVGLTALERVARLSTASDRPTIATSGSGSLAILSQDSLHAAYRTANAAEQYDPDRGRLAGPTPFSYVAGVLPVVRSEHVSTHLLIGNFGPEIGLVTDEADQVSAFTLAGSDSLPAQAVLYATTQEPLIGEELYAVPAYMQSGPIHTASLRAQDILRWGIAGAVLVGVILKLVGVL
ncbi:hypothetical protein FDZ74_07485 [bacterium]|nr:MAG: hypothetical protein FDZ74_07485 [bacterium]